MNNSTAKAKPKMTVKNGVVYGDALSAQEKKRIVMQKKKDRKAKKVRKSAQQTIPYVEMCRDGICKVKSRLYTKSIAFEDINYQLAQNEDKTAIFENWCDFLNYFDSSIFVQLSFINQKASLNEFRKRINIPAQEDAFNDIRSEYSGMLQSQLTKGNNGLVKRKYITFGIEADSLRTAKPKLERMLGAEAQYCRMEQELQSYLDTYESTHNYDEYHFDLDDIEHDPYVLISILSALHEGEFTLDEVQGTLQMLFEKQYILTEEVIVETRYRTETDTWTDADGNTHTETYRVPYDYYICNVKLENFNLSHVPVYIMGQEQLSILKNLVYTGTLVSRKMKSCGVGSKRRVVNEPIIVEGTHEAIISKEDFELAQKVIRGGGRNPTRKQHDYPLKGLVRCGNCKRAMTRRKNKAGIRYFQCIHSVNNGNTDCPVGRSFPEMDIEKVVFHALTQFLALAQKEAIQNREVGDLRKSAIKECADKIRTLQKQNEQHKASKLRLYEKYAAGSITKEAYIQQKATADVKIAENDGVIQRSHERMKELDSETACSDEKLDAVCEQYADCKALTHELTHTFISAVYIYDLDNIEIVWKFKDFLTTSEGEAK